VLRRELGRTAAGREEGALKLIVTRGNGRRGYRPTGAERCTRIMTLHALPKAMRSDALIPARVRLCATPLGTSARLAGIKTLNRLESVLARSEWHDVRIWEGLMRDADENIVCGTMSNVFLRRGSQLMTPVLDRCGVAGVMRRWILETAGRVGLTVAERRIRWRDLAAAEEVFMSNALVGIRSVAAIGHGRQRLDYAAFDAAVRLRQRLDDL
jgi:4-amino-4-deoxychorismate lyase